MKSPLEELDELAQFNYEASEQLRIALERELTFNPAKSLTGKIPANLEEWLKE